jgi:predicted enzyme related to lactoylglutathione lyase
MSKGVFSFTKLVVGDLDKSMAFYRDVCGLAEDRRISETIGGREMSEIIMTPPAPDAAALVLFAFLDSPEPAAGDSILGFRTTDVAAFVERAVKAGGSIMQPIVDMPQHGVKVAFVRDNEGHLIEVVEPL